MNKDLVKLLKKRKNIGIVSEKLEKFFFPMFTNIKVSKYYSYYENGNLFYDQPQVMEKPIIDVKHCEIRCVKFSHGINFEVNFLTIYFTKLDKCYPRNIWGTRKETDFKKLSELKIVSNFQLLFSNPNEINKLCEREEVLFENTWEKRCKELNISTEVLKIVECYFSIINRWIEEHREIISLKRNKILSNINEFDLNNNGIPDVLEKFPDLMTLLEENQNEMMETKHIQEIIRLIIRLEKKCDELKTLFIKLKILLTKKDGVISELNGMYSTLSMGLVSYQMTVISTLSMINSSITKKTVQYYREYELLESIGLFQSTWEKDVGQQLSKIDHSLKTVIHKISRMEQNIINSLKSNCNKIIEGVNELEMSINSSLSSIDSSISLNTFVTGIQTYQMYKVNKNTKSLRE